MVGGFALGAWGSDCNGAWVVWAQAVVLCITRKVINMSESLFRICPGGQPGALEALGRGQPAALVGDHSKGEGYIVQLRGLPVRQ